MVPRYLSSSGRFVLHYLRGRSWQFILLAAIVATAAVASVGAQVCMKLIVDAMSERRVAGVWHGLTAFMGLIIIESSLWRTSGWLGCRTTIGVGIDMRADLFDYLSGHAMQFFHHRLAGSLSHRLASTAGSFGALVNTAVWRIVPPCVDFAGAIILFARLNGRMALHLSFVVLAATALLGWLGKRGRPLHRAYARAANEVGGELTDGISNIWSIKAFNARRRYGIRLRERFGREARAQRRSWMFMEGTRLLHDMLLWGAAIWVLSTVVGLWSRGVVTAGDVVMTSALTFRLLHGSRDMAMALAEIMQHVAYIDETVREIGRAHAIADPPRPLPMPRSLAIKFEEVTFAYDGERSVICDLTLEIPPGEKVGIVGASGAGKSTLIGLVQRLYHPTRGRILVGDVSIEHLAQDGLRALLGVVPQEISLLHATVRDNLLFARPEATEAEMITAAKAAHCHEVVMKLSDGYDTVLGERGVTLSGGERQRLSIARVLLKNAPIVVLDEATSALDSESELHIRSALTELMRERTVIAIAHRLSTLAQFDRIVVMREGRIVEAGPTRELIRCGGVFEQMWRRQGASLVG